MSGSPRAVLVGGLLLVLAVGCSFSGEGKIKGKVLVGSKALTSGEVIFVGADGKRVTSGIGRDGSYRISRMSAGVTKIAVETHARAPEGLAHPRGAAVGAEEGSSVTRIPDRYRDPATSGLTLDVRGGEQDHNIELVLD
jgi:hypothetical protein